MATKESQPVCPHFLRGTCTFGTNCRRYHPPTHAQTAPTLTAGVPCPHFARGACRFGAACKNSHELVPAVQATSFSRPAISPFARTWSRSNQICTFYQQGKCTKADCRFQHPEPSASVPATRPARAASPPPDPAPTGASYKPQGSVTYITKEVNDPDPASQSLTLSLYNCVVRFTDGAKVGQVQTALESAKVIIRNLPLHATHQEVTTLVEPFGDLVSVTMNEVGDAEIARVEFVDHTTAQFAVTVLHEHDLRGHKLAVTLDMGKGALTKAVLRSTKVKLTWFRPSAVAYAHYESIAAAQTAARRLDGKMFNGQPIKATFQQPTYRQRTSFSVVLSGLPTRLNQTELSRFVGANATSFSIKQPPRSDFARETIVGTLLKEYGTLDAFELLPAQPGKVKVSAIAQFSRPEDASNAVVSLRGRKQAELQNSPLYAELVHSIKYQLRYRQLSALRLELERISATATDVKVRWYEFDAEGKQANPVVVRASATVAANLSLVKHRLDELLRGRILCYDGDIIWHNSWLSSTDPDALRTISDSLGVDLQADSRTRTVRYFGDPTKHEECEQTLYAHLLSLEAAYQRLGLRPLQMSAVMKHLPELRARFEDADISLDPVVRDLRVRGTEDKIRQIRGAIDRLLAYNTRKANSSGAECPVCFLPPEEDDIQELSCGHVYCRSCLGHLIKSSDDLCCPAKTGTESCNTSLPLSLIRTLVSPTEEERILTSAFLSYVNSRPGEFAYCPTPDCEMVFRTDAHTGSILTCPNCLTQICPSCKVAFHEGLTCEEHRDQASGGFEALQKWRVANGVKACPKCGVDIEKIAGCNHMTCARCKTHMCWVCLQMFGSDGGSVYTHLREKHGGI